MGNKSSKLNPEDNSNTEEKQLERGEKFIKVPRNLPYLPPLDQLRPLPAEFKFIFSPREFELAKIAEKGQVKIFLSAAGECGKTTFIKNLSLLTSETGDPFNLSDDSYQDHYLRLISNNVMLSLHALASNVQNYDLQLPPQIEKIAQELRSTEEIDSAVVKPEHIDDYIAFWNSPEIQVVWENRADASDGFMPMDYWMPKLKLMFGNDINTKYKVTGSDVLRIRVRTTGIAPYTFYSPDGSCFHLHDVGGQRNERKKWIHCYENIHIHISLASLSEFNQILFESADNNRLKESLKLFDDQTHSKWFQDSYKVLLLTKYDLFLEELQKGKFKQHHPNYSGDVYDAEGVLNYIVEEYRKRAGGEQLDVYVIDATDANDVAQVFYKLMNF